MFAFRPALLSGVYVDPSQAPRACH